MPGLVPSSRLGKPGRKWLKPARGCAGGGECSFTYTNSVCDFDFTYTGTGGTTFLWDFGDGETSTDENPSHEYEASGPTYTVTLTVDGTYQCSQQVTCGSSSDCDFLCDGGIGEESLVIVGATTAGTDSSGCGDKCADFEGAVVVPMTLGCSGQTLILDSGRDCQVCGGFTRAFHRLYTVSVTSATGGVILRVVVRPSWSTTSGDPCDPLGATYEKFLDSPATCAGTHTIPVVSDNDNICDFPSSVTLVL